MHILASLPSTLRRAATLVIAVLCGLLVGCANSGKCDSPYAASPQFKGCTFHNPPNPDARPSASGWVNWSRFILGTKTNTVPIDALPVRPLGAAQLAGLDPQANHLVRLGHSTVLLKLRGKYWLIDPMFSERASPLQWFGPKRFTQPPIALEQLPPIEGVLQSHDHYDHLDKATIAFLATRTQRFFVPLGVGQRLVDFGVPRDRITELDWWQDAEQGGVRVTATRTQHFSGRTLTDRDQTLWTSWVIQSGDQRLFYSGDGGYSEGFRMIGERYGGFDVAMMENGSYDNNWPSVHLTPEEGVQAFLDLRAKVLMPVHNSSFDMAFHTWHDPMDRMAEAAREKQVDLATPELGEVLTVGLPRSNRLWWKGLR